MQYNLRLKKSHDILCVYNKEARNNTQISQPHVFDIQYLRVTFPSPTPFYTISTPANQPFNRPPSSPRRLA